MGVGRNLWARRGLRPSADMILSRAGYPNDRAGDGHAGGSAGIWAAGRAGRAARASLQDRAAVRSALPQRSRVFGTCGPGTRQIPSLGSRFCRSSVPFDGLSRRDSTRGGRRVTPLLPVRSPPVAPAAEPDGHPSGVGHAPEGQGHQGVGTTPAVWILATEPDRRSRRRNGSTASTAKTPRTPRTAGGG